MLPAPADLEIGQRDLEPGAQLGGVEDRLQSLAGLVAQPLAAAVEQIGVGAPRRATNPPTKLVELGQAEGVGAIDDDRVGVRDVQPRLDDRGAHQDVGGAVGEGDHHLLERAFGHLAVADHEPDVGQHPAQLLGLRLDRLDPVVDVEDLAAAIELADDRVADQPGRRLGDPRLDRQPILRRRLDDAQVPDPRERQVERPRDRRGRQGQDVDLALELLQALLGGDPEALLLVDDDQPEILEPDVPGQQPVGADHQVHAAVGQARHGRRLRRRRDEARQEPDLEREGGEPLREGRVVLGREDRRGHQHGDLLAVLDRLERGAQGDLGLAVADVADDQPIHRPVRSMSALTSSAARSWSIVSSYGNEASISACHGVSSAKAWPRAWARVA